MLLSALRAQQYGTSCLNKQHSQVAIAALGDGPENCAPARRHLSRRESEPSAEISRCAHRDGASRTYIEPRSLTADGVTAKAMGNMSLLRRSGAVGRIGFGRGGCCRRRLRRGRRRLAERDREREQPPAPADRRIGQFEIHLRRHRRKEARHAHHANTFDLRQQRELRVDHSDTGQVDIILALLGEDFG